MLSAVDPSGFCDLTLPSPINLNKLVKSRVPKKTSPVPNQCSVVNGFLK